MVRTASTMLPLGTAAPEFELRDVVSGKIISLSDFSNEPDSINTRYKALLIMFICQHCPFVKHVENELSKIGHDYSKKSLGIVAISANDIENYPDDSPEKLKEMAVRLNLNFPFCYDETQEVSKVYTAACTPDFFLFDANHKLVYRGQLDDSRPSMDIPVTGQDLRKAIDRVLQNKTVDFIQKPSIGCNIKWKPGNEPEYFG